MGFLLLVKFLLITLTVALSEADCPSKACLSQDACTEQRLVHLENQVKYLLKNKGESCEKLKARGETKDGYYLIDVENEDPLRVFCNFTNIPVQTVIQHNYPKRTEAKDVPECGIGRIYNITYDAASRNQLVKLMEGKSCSQFLKYECHGSVISYKAKMLAYWADRNGRRMNYWPGGPPNGKGCACSLDKSCAGDGHLCNCEKNDGVWRSDQGYITDCTRLPVSALFLCDTNGANEEGFFTLGPLIIQE